MPKKRHCKLSRCGYRIFMRVCPSVGWSVGWSVHWSIGCSIGCLVHWLVHLSIHNAIVKFAKSVENHRFLMRLLHVFDKETVSIHWSIYLLVCPSIHPCIRLYATTFQKLQNLAKSSEINCKSIVQFVGSNTRKIKNLKRKLHIRSRIIVYTNLFFDPYLLFD